MTNRDYLMGLSNKELAEFIWSNYDDEICDCVETSYCDSHNCVDCIKNWLDTKRTLKVEKGQIRQAKPGIYYLILYVRNDGECIVLDDDGFIVKKLTRVVGTWKVVENVDVDEFLERICENL